MIAFLIGLLISWCRLAGKLVSRSDRATSYASLLDCDGERPMRLSLIAVPENLASPSILAVPVHRVMRVDRLMTVPEATERTELFQRVMCV